MKKLNFKWLAVFCMAMGFVNVAKAQIDYEGAVFYVEAGKDSHASVQIVCFEGDKCWVNPQAISSKITNESVRKNLAKDENYYENNREWNMRHSTYVDSKRFYVSYDYRLSSNSSKEVYSANYSYISSGGAFVARGSWSIFFAFSQDLSSMIVWKEEGNNEPKPQYYTRVPKEDLLPKATKYDFLND